MTLLKEFILPRFAQWLIVIFVGVTITFIIPRLSPVNPVMEALARMQMYQNINPEAVQIMRESLLDLYGLEGSVLEQYVNFWKRILKGDLGPSLASFPMSVNQLIGVSIGWTIGLLGTSILIAWTLGMTLGSLGRLLPEPLVVGRLGEIADHRLPGALLHFGFFVADCFHILPADIPTYRRGAGHSGSNLGIHQQRVGSWFLAGFIHHHWRDRPSLHYGQSADDDREIQRLCAVRTDGGAA